MNDRPRPIVVIQGHPDTAQPHLCHAMAEAYARGADAAGHDVTRVSVAEYDFPLLRSQDDWMAGRAGTPPALLDVQDRCVAAAHIVIVFPLWLGTMPALLKGFMEQTFRPGVALSYGATYPQPLFKGKSARLIVTMGMPSLAYRLYYRAHGVRNLERSILGFAGVRPVRTALFGMVGQRNEQRRQVWLDRVRALGAAAR